MTFNNEKLSTVDPVTLQSYIGDMKLLVAYPAYVFKPIRDIAELLTTCFKDMGVSTDIKGLNSSLELDTVARNSEYSHILSINNHDYLEQERGFYIDKPKHTKLLAYNLEQSPIEDHCSGWASMRLSEIAGYGPYFDYIVHESPSKKHDVCSLGLRTLHLDLPYHPVLDSFVQHDIKKKIYDVFFIGAGNDRRGKIVEDLKKEGVTFAPAPIPQAYGNDFKREMVLRSKLCLNVHFSEMEYFEKPRLMYDFFVNKATVLSEKILFPESFKNLEDLYMAKYNNMVPLTLLTLKKYDENMIKTGEHAYNTFTTQYHYEKVIMSFLEELCYKETKFSQQACNKKSNHITK